MLGRLKFEIDELVNEMLDQLPEEVFKSKTTTFLDPCMGGGQFVKEVEARLRKYGHSDANIAKRVFGIESSELRVKYAVERHGLVGQYFVHENYLESDETMKFDVVIGNPPYQDKDGNEDSTNSKALYVRFTNRAFELTSKYVAFVIPSAWTGPRNGILKTLLFQDNQPIILNTHKTKWFDVKMNTCYFISEKDRKGPTTLTDNFNNRLVVELTKESAIPTNLAHMQLMSKVGAFTKKNNLASRWIRGKVHLNELETKYPQRDLVNLVCAVGKKDKPVTLQKIPKSLESTGFGTHKVVLPNMGSSDAIGNVKIAKRDYVGGHSVVFLTTDSLEESKNLKAYLESKLVRFIFESVKISTPNSKSTFEFVPEVDLTRTWTDKELYKHFGLTKEEIAYIEATVK